MHEEFCSTRFKSLSDERGLGGEEHALAVGEVEGGVDRPVQVVSDRVGVGVDLLRESVANRANLALLLLLHSKAVGDQEVCPRIKVSLHCVPHSHADFFHRVKCEDEAPGSA